MSRIRVLQVITAFNDEAPAQSAAVLAKYLDRAKFDVIAVSLRAPPGLPSMTVQELTRAGIPHASMGMRTFLDIAGIWRLARFIRKWRPDVVHSHALRADIWCGLVGRLAGVPLIVCTIRNHDSQVLRMEHSVLVGRLAAAASRFAVGLADSLVAVSEGVAHYLTSDQRVPAAKIHVIRNGFDFERLTEARASRDGLLGEFGWEAGDVVVGTLAILKPRKGLTYLVQAARDVLSAHPRARFFIAGEGPERQALEAEIARLGLEKRVLLLGQRRDPLALLDLADVYVLPSLFEGLPRSLLEAMAFGKPVVVTDIGGSREVVEHQESGLIVAPRDATGLAGAISRLVASPDIRREYGAAGRRAVERQFDARRTATAHEVVYDLLATRRRVLRRNETARPSGAQMGTP